MAKLKPRARIIRTIGDQLISGPEAALIELVKNAYDADANWVKIVIEPKSAQNPMGLILVCDDGHGMQSSDVINKWFEPATNKKKIDRYSKSGTRVMLGAKGIGRFASAMLGNYTILSTSAHVDENFVKKEETLIQISWEEFDTDKYLDELDVPYKSSYIVPTSQNDAGTQIAITDLRIEWSKNSLLRLINELRRLISDKEIQKVFNIFLDITLFKKSETANSFDGTELLEDALSDFFVADQAPNNTHTGEIRPFRVHESCDYLLTGIFDEEGGFQGNFCIERGDNKPIKISLPALTLDVDEEKCGPFQIKFQIYDGDSDSILSLFLRMGVDISNGLGVRKARKILTESSGVGVYRDGFRIRPYGDHDFDWLNLEKRRVQEPSKRVGHTQISGAVYISDESQSGLVERSSREGLEHNGSFTRLKRLITNILIRVEEQRYEFRYKAGIGRKPTKDFDHVRELADLSNLKEEVKKLPPEHQKTLMEKIRSESAQITKKLDDLNEYQKLLESKSVLGMLVARVIHDGRRYLEPVSSAAKSLIDGKDFLFEDSKKGEVIRKYYPIHAEIIADGAKGLNSLFKALDPVSGKKRGKPVNFSVSDVINSVLNLLGDQLIESGIESINEVDDSLLMHGYAADLQTALMNVVDNAIHWLNSLTMVDRHIVFRAKSDANSIKLSVSNNGPQVEDAFSSRIFEPGFTLKSEGLGIGLTIALVACRDSQGDLYLDDTEIDTTFIIAFPKGERIGTSV